jgi:hypothetical protein
MAARAKIAAEEVGAHDLAAARRQIDAFCAAPTAPPRSITARC